MYNVAHVGIVVQDAERSTEFYTGVLGCQVVETYEDERIKLVFLRAGDQIIELVKYYQKEINREAGIIDHIAFRVEDLEQEIEQLTAKNVEFLYDAPIIVGSKKIIFFIGPDGERLELVEEMAK